MKPEDLQVAVVAADKPQLELLVDAFFAGLLVKYKGNLAAELIIKGVNGAVDGLLAAFGL